jgi:hypothetical protein
MHGGILLDPLILLSLLLDLGQVVQAPLFIKVGSFQKIVQAPYLNSSGSFSSYYACMC